MESWNLLALVLQILITVEDTVLCAGTAFSLFWREGVTTSSETDLLAREWLKSGMACPMKWKKQTQLQSLSVYTDVTVWAQWRPPENDEKDIGKICNTCTFIIISLTGLQF